MSVSLPLLRRFLFHPKGRRSLGTEGENEPSSPREAKPVLTRSRSGAKKHKYQIRPPKHPRTLYELALWVGRDPQGAFFRM